MKFRTVAKVVIGLLFGMICASSQAKLMVISEFDSLNSKRILYIVSLEGSITDDDGLGFETLMAVAKNKGKSANFNVNLNSTGGDLNAAIAIGRILRQTDSIVVGAKNDICMSACVFVLAGGTRRATEPGFKVGIHRPYSVQATVTTPEQEKAKYQQLQQKIETFLKEMNVTPNLYKDMVVIPPGQIKVLTFRELESYGLANNDPYTDEADAMKKAQKYNISRKELIRRENLSSSVCNPWACESDRNDPKGCKRYFECDERILKTGK